MVYVLIRQSYRSMIVCKLSTCVIICVIILRCCHCARVGVSFIQHGSITSVLLPIGSVVGDVLHFLQGASVACCSRSGCRWLLEVVSDSLRDSSGGN